MSRWLTTEQLIKKYHEIPARMVMHLVAYRDEGYQLGDFLSAFLSNNLMTALERADNINMYLFHVYGRFLLYEMPICSWGSPNAYKIWIDKGGLSGSQDE